MKETIEQETRKYFCYIKSYVEHGEECILLYLSGSIQKRNKMYKEVKKYEDYAKIDFELGIISKDEYNIEMKSVRLMEQSLSFFSVF